MLFKSVVVSAFFTPKLEVEMLTVDVIAIDTTLTDGAYQHSDFVYPNEDNHSINKKIFSNALI